MSEPFSLYLIGPMGAGKSTIGRLLSAELALTFVDSDKEIEERCGANIPWIFDKEGEVGFRKREEQVIEELSKKPSLLMATGGGVVMTPANRVHLKENGIVVYLRTSVEQQIIRTSRDRGRPLLQTENPEKVLRDLFEIRDPLYRETADIIIQTDNRNPKSVVQEILKNVDKIRQSANHEDT